MFRSFRSRLIPAVPASEIGAVAICGGVVATWAGLAVGTFTLRTLLICEAAFLAFYLVGSLASRSRRLAAGLLFDLPLKLLVGYSVVNTALLVLAWLSPLGIVGNFVGLLVLVLALAIMAFVRSRSGWSGTRPRPTLTGIGAMMLALVAATLWCQDSILPIDVVGSSIHLKPWTDGFYHATHIRMFSSAHGASSIQDFRMAGVPIQLYHYAAYLTPALIKQAAGLPSYYVFAGVLVPMGVFFTGLGAYVLTASLWGTWPGIAACAALMLLPDGAQQGMHNQFLSYHWLAQISPAATFGLSMIALAWLFMLRGCQRGSLFQVFVGCAYGVLVAVYKAQFFVAIALVMLIVPPFFLRRRLHLGLRLAWFAGAITTLVLAIIATRDFPSLPVLRLDGSSTGKLLDLVLSMASSKAPGTFIASWVGEGKPRIANVVFGAGYLLLGTLGIIVPSLVALLVHLRKRIVPLLWVFPLFIAANFLLMALGLALDNRNIGTPEELQHRPFLVMYFALAAWTGAAAGVALVGSRRLGYLAKPAIAILVLAFTIVPLRGGEKAQHFRAMPNESGKLISPGLLGAIEFMREHGAEHDIFQSSDLDPTYLIAALADRQPYFNRQPFWVRASAKPLMDERTARVAKLMNSTEAKVVTSMAWDLGLRWFLLVPGHGVGWPDSIVKKPAFEAGGFRLYRF